MQHDVDEYQELSPETKRLLAGQEGRGVDFKAKPEGVKPEDFVAFANGRGGCILVGVEERTGENGEQYGEITGVLVEDRVRQGFISMAVSCRPAIDIDIRIENLGGLPIFRIDIPEGTQKPYCTASGLYKIRAEGQNIPIDPAMMRAIILEQAPDQFFARFRQAADDLLERMASLMDSRAAPQIRVDDPGAESEASRGGML